MKKTLLLFSCLLFGVSLIQAQQKALTLDDYERWNRIVSTELSDNGAWMTYGLQPNGGDDTLFIQHLNDSERFYRIPFAESPEFSENSEWVAYLVTPNEKEAEKLKKSKKPLFNTAVLHRLSDGETWSFERANSMAFTRNSRHFAVHLKKTADDKSEHEGSDLVLVDLVSGTAQNIGNVSDFAFNERGSHLAYIVDAAEKVGNGVYLLNLNSGTINMLDGGRAQYANLTWNDEGRLRPEWAGSGNALAVLKGTKPDTLEHRENVLLTFTGLGSANVVKKMLDPTETSGFPENMVISENGDLHWTSDYGMVLFGIREQEETVKLDKDTVANVDIFHYADETINSVQRIRARRNRNYTYLSGFRLSDGSFRQLANESLREISDSRHARYWVGRNEKPYVSDVNWGISPADLYRVDLVSGEATPFEKLVKRPLGYSPDGRYYLYQKDEELHVYDLKDQRKTTISKSAPVSFVNAEHPYPHENPPYGLAGWTKDGKGVIVNHRYDLWYLSLDGGTATNITKGMGDKEEIRFRYANLSREEPYIDTSKPLMLSAYGEWTKKSGYYSLTMGQQPKVLHYVDKSIGRLNKARQTDRVIFTQETFADYPDYYVSTTALNDMRKVTDANPQQAEYAWGRRILIDYTNSKGDRLQGTLALPPDYEAGKRYPMVVYFYEKMSQRHHNYSMPRYDDRPHASTYTSNGYLFFMPDNVYETGRPGTSSLDCITSAVQEVIDQGYADPDRIGLQGHSWGGYQSSFIVTQTDMFACVVTGAPPTDIESFYNNIYGNSGTNHTGIMEIGQVRMGRDVTPWSHREVYQRENPMYHAPKISTPFMILHGTNDGAVDWTQGLEFYNAARRLGKEVIFLSYPNEGHHLRREANQKDFQIRMKQYFDHYLIDAPAPEWMIKGIPHLEKKYEKAGQ